MYARAKRADYHVLTKHLNLPIRITCGMGVIIGQRIKMSIGERINLGKYLPCRYLTKLVGYVKAGLLGVGRLGLVAEEGLPES